MAFENAGIDLSKTRDREQKTDGQRLLSFNVDV